MRARATVGVQSPLLFHEMNRNSKWLVENGTPQNIVNIVSGRVQHLEFTALVSSGKLHAIQRLFWNWKTCIAFTTLSQSLFYSKASDIFQFEHMCRFEDGSIVRRLSCSCCMTGMIMLFIPNSIPLQYTHAQGGTIQDIGKSASKNRKNRACTTTIAAIRAINYASAR